MAGLGLAGPRFFFFFFVEEAAARSPAARSVFCWPAVRRAYGPHMYFKCCLNFRGSMSFAQQGHFTLQRACSLLYSYSSTGYDVSTTSAFCSFSGVTRLRFP